jgi:hypothetical protein
VRITRFGKPVADIVAPTLEPPRHEWLGSLRGTIAIQDDIVAPSSELMERSGSFDWLADEPNLYNLDDGEPV